METFFIKQTHQPSSCKQLFEKFLRPRLWSEDEKISTNFKRKYNNQYVPIEGINNDNKLKNTTDNKNSAEWMPEIPFENVCL